MQKHCIKNNNVVVFSQRGNIHDFRNQIQQL